MAWYLSFREGNQQKNKTKSDSRCFFALAPATRIWFSSSRKLTTVRLDLKTIDRAWPTFWAGQLGAESCFLMLMLLIHLSIHLRFIQYLRIKINIDKFHKSILIHWCLYSVENWFYKWILSTTISLKERVWPYIYTYISHTFLLYINYLSHDGMVFSQAGRVRSVFSSAKDVWTGYRIG